MPHPFRRTGWGTDSNAENVSKTRPPPVARLRSELPAKVLLLLGLAVGICVPYFTLQRVKLFPARTAPATWLAASVPFDPGWNLALPLPGHPRATLPIARAGGTSRA